MKRRGVGENSPIKQFIGGVYKVIGFWFGKLKTRLLGVRNDSWGLVVFEKEIVKETVI